MLASRILFHTLHNHVFYRRLEFGPVLTISVATKEQAARQSTYFAPPETNTVFGSARAAALRCRNSLDTHLSSKVATPHSKFPGQWDTDGYSTNHEHHRYRLGLFRINHQACYFASISARTWLVLVRLHRFLVVKTSRFKASPGSRLLPCGLKSLF